ncbi:MAG: hypothetical protein IT209_10845 [Armatimonadetes bacterium]|nr:hypothetical protein [Armatimonadota bacterium]
MSLSGLESLIKDCKRNPTVRLLRTESLTDETLSLPEREPRTHRSDIVEGSVLASHDVPKGGRSSFTHFLDGIERRRVLLYSDCIPVVWGYVAACVRRRSEDQLMCPVQALTCSEHGLYFPFELLSPTSFKRYEGLRVHDVRPLKGSETVSDNTFDVQRQAFNAVSNRRAEQEADLLQSWGAFSSDRDWLLVDGALSSSFRKGAQERVVGVIKSHLARYFEGDDYRLILNLKVGQRTSVFRPRVPNLEPVYSWYLRLHDDTGRDPTFGLVRLEACAEVGTLSMADEISAWLMAERSPLSLPDARWDRMIYPIYDCEQYLKALAPSRAHIEALVS